MASFNLTAELNLRGPSNINQVVGNIRRQLSTLTLDLNINPSTSRGVQAVTANIRTLSTALRDAQNNAAALSSTLSNLVTTINNAGNAATNAGNAINRLNTQTRAAQSAARDGATSMENFGAQSALAIRRFAAFSVATGAVYAFTRALSSAFSEFVNFNKEFVRLQQVTNSTASGLSGLSQEITRLSTGLGVSSSELLNVSTTLAQAGLSANQTKVALEALAKSALAPSFDSLNETVEGSIALMRQFGLSAGDLEGALGSINAVAAKFAVESSDIITAIQRTGGVFAAASKGVSQGKDALNEFIAVFTSVRATTRESAETIATGLRTIFTRIQRGNTIQALKEYGITLTDLEGKFVGPYEAVRRLSEGLRGLDPRDLRFSEIVEELGGFRQIGKVIPLIQQFATAQQALSVAQRGSGSLAGDAAKAQESLAVRVTKVREEFVALIRDIGQTQSFQKFVDISLQLASALISVASAAKDVLPAITAIAAIRAVPAIAQFAGGFGRGITRRNQGGPINKFATGGLVPGSGNRDTVPAMLTPGEFVIRKKAVETIGANNLARMNTGGIVQKFDEGSPGGVRLPRGRGRRGKKGARARFDLPQPGDKDYLEWVRQIYAEYDADPSLPKVKVNGIPMPPEIAYAEKLITKEVFERDGSGMMLGYDAKGNEVIGKFGTAKAKKSGKLKKTPLGLLISAAGMKRGSRAPVGEMEKILSGYEKDPEYRKSVRLTNTASVQKALSAFRKSGGQTSLSGVFSDSDISKIEAGIPKYIETLADEPQKIAKAKLTQQYLRSFAGGAMASKPGHATAFSETINQMLKSGIIQEFANGGIVQKFANGGKPLRQKMTREDRILQGMVDKSGVYKFGVAALRAGSGKKEDVSFFGSAPRGQISSKLLEQFTIPGNPPKKGQFYVGTLATKGLDDTIESVLKNSLSESVSNASSILASQVGTTPIRSTAALSRIYKGSGFQSVIGSSLEAAIASIGAPYIDKTEATKSFDFPLGLGPAASLFGIPGNIPTDATRTIGGFGKSKKKLEAAATRFVQAVEDKEFTKSRIKKAQDRLIDKTNMSSLLPRILSTIPPGLNSSASGLALRTKYGLARSGLTSRGIKGSLEIAAKKGKDKEFLTDLELEIAKLQKPYATGGSVQDTVPALLTPGEFVVNKKAAQRIGYSNLNTLNKADKIQGFNKGGAVGSIQKFADGGMATLGNVAFGAAAIAALTAITLRFRELSTIVTGLTGNLRGFNRAVDMGLPRTGQGTRRGGSNPRNFDPQESFINRRGLSGFGKTADAFGITFAAAGAASSLGDAVGGRTGRGISEAGGAAGGIFGLAAAFGALSNPIGLAITSVVALTSAFVSYRKAVREATIEEEQKKIESRSGILDKSFERMISGRSREDRSANTERFLATLAENIKSEEKIKQQEIEKASPFFNIGLTSDTLANAFDYNKLGSRFSEISKDSSERILNFINQGLSQNQNLETILQQLEKGGISRESSRMAIGLSSIRSVEIAQAKARVEASEAVDRLYGNKTPSETTQSNRAVLAQLLAAVVEDFNKLNNVNREVQKASAEAAVKLNSFVDAIKTVASAANRASAEFQEAQRQIDIDVGSRLGGQANIAGPSRINENVLQNLRAYSADEIRNVVTQFGQNLNLNPEFTRRTTGAALSQRVLETDLPRILGTIRDDQRTSDFGKGDRGIQISKELRKALELGGVVGTDANAIIDEVLNNLQKLGKGEVTFDDIINSSATFAKLFQTNSEALQSAINIMQSFNGTMEAVVARTNEYVTAIESAINAQTQAAQIRAGGSLQLREALGERIPLRERNALFNNEVLGMTATIGAGNRPIAGTGTTDPNEIARRLAAADQRKRELEAQRTSSSPQKFAAQLSQVTLQIRQYENALKKLASDTNRASNALSEISKLRQIRETRQESFLDFASNANDPEYLLNTIRQAGALQSVMSGRGRMDDIQAAREGFQRRAAAGFVPPDQLERERTQFIQQVIRILEQASGSQLPRELKQQIASDFGTLGEEKDAITEFNNAFEAQARATEKMASRTIEGAQLLYKKIEEAGDLWIKKVRESTNLVNMQGGVPPAAPVQQAGTNATGGLIYANQGQLINFQPKGTDTVPAMLTPGEFVVNARATKKNLGLLKQINSSGKAGGFSRGGVVYLADGGRAGKYPKLGGGRTDDIAEADQSQFEVNELIALANDNNNIAGMARQIAQIRLQDMGIDWKSKANPEVKAKNEGNGKKIIILPDGRIVSYEYSSYNPSNQRQEYTFKDEKGDWVTLTSEQLGDSIKQLPQTPRSEPPPRKTEQTQAQPTQEISPRQKAIQQAQEEKAKRKQAFLEEKERRKQAAMANNPGYAARVRKQEEKRQKEEKAAADYVKDKYGSSYDNPKDNINEYRAFKRERAAEMAADQARADRAVRARRESREAQDVTIDPLSGPILSRKEIEKIERENYGGLTKAEYDAKINAEQQARQARIAEIDARLAANQTPEAKRAEKERDERLARAEEARLAERQKWKKDIADREARDADARSRGYRDAAQEAGAQARQKAEATRAEQRATAKQEQEIKKALRDKLVASGENFGATWTVPYMTKEFETNSKYENTRKDFGLSEYIKTRIQEKYGSLMRGDAGARASDDGGSAVRDRANLERLVSAATVEYYDKQRELKDRFNKTGGISVSENAGLALQQFGQGINESKIFATPIALGKSALGVLEGVGGGLGYVAGKAIGGDLGAGLQESSGNVIERARARIQESGATLGVRMGLDTIAGGTYAEAAARAQQKIEQSKQKQIEGSKGAYSTEELKRSQYSALRIAGELLTPENVTTGAMNVAEVTGQAAADLAIGQTNLVERGGAAIQQGAKLAGKGVSRGVNVLNRGIEGIGNKLVDNVLNIELPRPRIAQRLEARRVARETRIDQAAQTRKALREAETRAKIAEANRNINIIPMEDIERDIATRVTRGYEINQSLAEMGIPPLDFSGKSFAQIAREASENITPENIPKTTSNFSRTRKSTDTVGEPYEMSSREDFLKRQAERQAEIQARKQAITQSGKQSGSVSTPLNQPKASGRITSSLVEAPKLKPETIKAIMPEGKQVFIQGTRGNRQNAQGLTGWKNRLTPKDDASALAIRDWIEANGKELGIANYKIEGNSFTVYSETGSRAAVTGIASKAEKELADKLNFGLFDESDTFIPGTKISGRFDAADLNKNIGLRDQLLEQQLKDSKYATGYRAAVAESDSAVLPSQKKYPLAGVGMPTGAAGIGGVPNTGYIAYLKSMKDRVKLAGRSTEAYDKEILRATEIADEWLKKNIETYSKGGVVYASKGTLVPYQPRGTDTVPAMLTPGEFVVNRQATQRNLPLLKAINNNSQYMSRGGKVQYFEGGSDGPVSNMSNGSGGVSSFKLDSSAFTDSVGAFNGSVGELKTLLGGFGNNAGELARSATTLSTALGSVGTSAGALSIAATILQGATQGLSAPITKFTSALDSMTALFNNMKDINLNITGSIPPISITVEVNGGDGLKEELQPFADTIYSQIGQRLAQATNGLFKINQ